MVRDGLLGEASEREAFRKYLKAASKGVLKVMSKMGISTVASYTGAQVFEAIGLDRALVDRYFGSTPSRLGGIGLAELAEEVARRHRYAYEGPRGGPGRARDRGRRRVPVAAGRRVPPVQPEDRLQAPARDTFQALRHLQGVQPPGRRAVRDGWRPCAACCELRKSGDASVRSPVPIEEVEPVEAIVKRFATGAMSFGSICRRRTRPWPSP